MSYQGLLNQKASTPGRCASRGCDHPRCDNAAQKTLRCRKLRLLGQDLDRGHGRVIFDRQKFQ